MPIIARLAHPIHGEKDAYSPAEVKEAKENGWEEITPGDPDTPSFFSVTTTDDKTAEEAKVTLDDLTGQVKAEQEKLDAVKHQLKGETTKLGNLKTQVKEEQAKLDAIKAQQLSVVPPGGPNIGAIANAISNQGT